MTVTVPRTGIETLALEDVSAMDLRAAVFKGTAPAQSTMRGWEFLSDAIASALVEATATNYARQDLAAVTVAIVGDGIEWTADAPTITDVGSGETWTTVVFYKEGASDAARKVISIDVPAATQATNGGPITLPAFSVAVNQA